MIMSIVLFEDQFIHIVSISFTALIFNELLMVALEIHTWYVICICRALLMRHHIGVKRFLFYRHAYMILSEIVTLAIYCISMVFLPTYFGKLLLCFFIYTHDYE